MFKDNMEESQTHREKPDHVYDRFIGYSLLKNIRHNGEPVVPRILREGKDDKGLFFETEELPGTDLDVFLMDSKPTIEQKMQVMMEVTKQLMTIDRAGYMLLDRHGQNIRVLKHEGKISVRQMDIQDLYDKEAGTVYVSGYRKVYDELIDGWKERGVDLWAQTVNFLLKLELLALKNANKTEATELLDQHRWSDNHMKNGSNLNDHLQALKDVYDML